MPCYKIEKLGIVRYLNFVDLTSAQAYADGLGAGFVASLQDVQDYPPISDIKQLAEVGAVDATRELLVGLTGLPIAGVYTELRREKDLLRIDSYNDSL